MFRAVSANYEITTRSAITAALKAIRTALAAVCQERYVGVAEQLELAHNAVTSDVLSCSTAVRAEGIASHAKWIRILQSFRGSVQRIRHVRVDARDAVLRWTRAHSACDGLVISKWLAGTRVVFREESADGEIVHRA